MPRRRRLQLVALSGLMLASALAEILSLGAILPFIGILTQPDRALEYPFVAALVEWMGLEDLADIRLTFTLIFVAASLCAGAIRLLYFLEHHAVILCDLF